jgi:hypothetical protein
MHQDQGLDPQGQGQGQGLDFQGQGPRPRTTSLIQLLEVYK